MQGTPGTRKRGSFDADADVTSNKKAKSAQVVRDSVFYKPGGDCKIRVEDTVFCIHRFLLERDSATFQTMFELPQGIEKPQGSTDGDPIVLAGDTLEEFRALCWALYAFPNEIVDENEDRKSLEKLANLAMIAHKYQLGAFQSWSMTAIRKKCHTPDGALESCPSRLLPTIIRLSLRYHDDALKSRVISAWISRLSNATSPLPSFSPLPTSEFSDALEFAEENSLRQFLGKLYYAKLIVAHRDLDKSVFPSVNFPFEGLDPRHMQRILRGSWSLSAYWQHLSCSKAVLPGASCIHGLRCQAKRTASWALAEQEGPTDVLGRLKLINDSLFGVHSKKFVDSSDSDDSEFVDKQGGRLIAKFPCAKKESEILKSLITQLEGALPDYFLGPP
ncbi:hypothetical protein C8F04DRAFT_559659 [Mycena alexandri]|uniref:BTB domain-containing protein n=1 Tax=Mycena alexandri TaxID=1745969 RepID=A0AAD6SVB6_9AGAR|nr:hypothetical protein C8F04DRAFT_559659 [Mycena alexandri]